MFLLLACGGGLGAIQGWEERNGGKQKGLLMANANFWAFEMIGLWAAKMSIGSQITKRYEPPVAFPVLTLARLYLLLDDRNADTNVVLLLMRINIFAIGHCLPLHLSHWPALYVISRVPNRCFLLCSRTFLC